MFLFICLKFIRNLPGFILCWVQTRDYLSAQEELFDVKGNKLEKGQLFSEKDERASEKKKVFSCEGETTFLKDQEPGRTGKNRQDWEEPGSAHFHTHPHIALWTSRKLST